MDGESYHVPREVSLLFQDAVENETGVAGGRDKADLMMEE